MRFSNVCFERYIRLGRHGSPDGCPSRWNEQAKASRRQRATATTSLRSSAAVASGSLPHLNKLQDSTLMPFDKPEGGARPIAIGEVWCRPLRY
jgi:hypothetical protein